MRKISLLLLLAFSYSLNGQETIVLDEKFDDNSNNWHLQDDETYTSAIKNGVFYIKNKTEKAKWFLYKTDIVGSEVDFTVETSITQLSGVDNYGFGLIWAGYSDDSNYEKYFITGNGQVLLDHFYRAKDHRLLGWQKTEAIKPVTQANILRVERRANIVRFFLNGVEIFTSGQFDYFGSKFGIYIQNEMEIQVDYIKVTTQPKQIDVVPDYNKTAERIKLGPEINTEYGELVPVIAPDGKTLFCNRKRHPDNTGAEHKDDAWFSTLNENGEWSVMQKLDPAINNESHNWVISVSPDNNTMLVGGTYRADGTYGGVGVSLTHKSEDGWEIPKKMVIEDYYNDNKYVEFFLSNDNKTLLLSVERKDGFGLKDIYVSFLQGDNSWSKPKNLGPDVNTSDEEASIFLAADNKTMYYSTRGLPGYGSYDVFVCKRLDDTWQKWSKPMNMGDIINTAGAELGFYLAAKGDVAYVSSREDIYKIDNSAKPEPVVLVSGTVYNKKTMAPMSAAIKYYNLEENIELGIAMSNPKSGTYKIVLPLGSLYSFLAEKDAFYSITEKLDVHELKEYTELTVDLYLSPIEKGEVIRLNNIFFEFNKADLKSDSNNELDRLVNILLKQPELKIQIGGHTDDVGSEAYNLNLSDDRAKSVLNYLVSKGVKREQLESKGYGESKPEVKNEDDASRARNRRVEFKVL